jgi:sulfur carrier protein
MEIKLNGKSTVLESGNLSLLDLLAAQGINAEAAGIAVAINWAVVPRSQWASQRIAAGDEVEIITARQGG